MILLQWEALYTNRKYLHYIVESGRALDLLVLMLYYAKESQLEGIGRVCIFSLQTLSAEPAFGLLLNRTFEAHESIPASIQIKNFHGRYSDFFILVRQPQAVSHSFIPLTDLVHLVSARLCWQRSWLLVCGFDGHDQQCRTPCHRPCSPDLLEIDPHVCSNVEAAGDICR